MTLSNLLDSEFDNDNSLCFFSTLFQSCCDCLVYIGFTAVPLVFHAEYNAAPKKLVII